MHGGVAFACRFGTDVCSGCLDNAEMEDAMIYAYKASNSDFEHIGNTSLIPTEAYTESELNGTWTARLVHPIDPEGRWEFIEPDGVIKMPSWNGDQFYRIVNRLKENDYITCEMYPIFFDSMNDLFLPSVKPSNRTGQQALTMMLHGSTKYSAISDITTRKSAAFVNKNFMEALTGDEEKSFLSIWGGEIEYDNFTVKVNSVLGSDRGLTIRYGLNLQGVQEEIDMSEILTRVYAQAYNGRPMSSPGYVDSPLIASYPTVKAGVVVFDTIKAAGDATEEDEEDPTIIICHSQAELDAALTSAVNAAFADGLDKPRINVSLTGMVDLSKIQGFAGLVNPIGLGDIAHLSNNKIGIETDARVVYIKYDSIREMAEDIQIGTKQLNYFQSLSDSQTQAASAYRMAEAGLAKSTNTDSLLKSGTAGMYLKSNGTDPVWSAIDTASNTAIASGSYTPASTGTWLNTGIEFTTTKRQLIFLFASDRVSGLGLSENNTATRPGIMCYESDNARRTPTFIIPAGTYYIYIKASSANAARTIGAYAVTMS